MATIAAVEDQFAGSKQDLAEKLAALDESILSP